MFLVHTCCLFYFLLLCLIVHSSDNYTRRDENFKTSPAEYLCSIPSTYFDVNKQRDLRSTDRTKRRQDCSMTHVGNRVLMHCIISPTTAGITSNTSHRCRCCSRIMTLSLSEKLPLQGRRIVAKAAAIRTSGKTHQIDSRGASSSTTCCHSGGAHCCNRKHTPLCGAIAVDTATPSQNRCRCQTVAGSPCAARSTREPGRNPWSTSDARHYAALSRRRGIKHSGYTGGGSTVSTRRCHLYADDATNACWSSNGMKKWCGRYIKSRMNEVGVES